MRHVIQVYVLFLGIIVAGSAGITSCASARPTMTTAAMGELDCTTPQIATTVLALGSVLKAYVISKIGRDGKTVDTKALVADAKALGSTAWTCGLSTAFALLLQPRTSVLVDGGPDPDVLRAAFNTVRRELGVGRVTTSVGVIP